MLPDDLDEARMHRRPDRAPSAATRRRATGDLIDFTQAGVKGFRQHPTALLYGLEGASIEKA